MEFRLHFRDLLTKLDDLSRQLQTVFHSVARHLLFELNASTSHFMSKVDQFKF